MSMTEPVKSEGDRSVSIGMPNSEEHSTAPLTKFMIETLITTSSQRITLTRKDNAGSTRSSVWDSFTVVNVDGNPVDYVRCDKCSSVLTWKSGNTSALSRHATSCRNTVEKKFTGQQMTLDQFQKKHVPSSAVKELNNAITIGLAKDLKPLGMIGGKGFNYIAEKLVNFGAKYGFQKADSFLQHPTTLKRNLPLLVKKEKELIVASLKTAPSYPKFAFTTDMWTDACQQRHFLSLSIHYIDTDFHLKSFMLAVDEFPDVDKSTKNIRTECDRILRQYFNNKMGDVEEVDEIIKNAVSVTDGGSNFLKVFPRRLPCMCHKLNNAIHWMFNDKAPKQDSALPANAKKQFVLSDSCPTIKNTLSAVKNVVTYFKRSGLNSKLQITLKQENDTRWNSKLRMLESYQVSNSDVKKILLEKNDLAKIILIDDSAVVELIEFLKPFRSCTESWSQDKQPCIQNVVLWIHQLRSHIEIQDKDSEEMKKLKKQAEICLSEYLQVDDIYYLACMLDPRYKKLKFADSDARRRAVGLLRQKVDEIVLDSSDNIIPTKSDNQVPSVKRGKFEDLEDSDSSEDEQSSVKHEVDVYLESKSKKGDSFQVLDYWKAATHLPKLRKVAMEILAIPASQTTDERVFSSTGATLSPRRTELKGSTLSNLTFIHKNYNL